MEIKSRVRERHAVGLSTTCQVQGETDQRGCPAQIRDVSQSGVGLVLERRFEPGTELDFEVPETAQNLPGRLPVRVVHASALPGGKWLHGCEFVRPLNDQELPRFLGQGKPQPEAAALGVKPAVRSAPLSAFLVDQVFATWFGRVQGAAGTVFQRTVCTTTPNPRRGLEAP